jgi:hypothetical protein
MAAMPFLYALIMKYDGVALRVSESRGHVISRFPRTGKAGLACLGDDISTSSATQLGNTTMTTIGTTGYRAQRLLPSRERFGVLLDCSVVEFGRPPSARGQSGIRGTHLKTEETAMR